MPNAEIERLKLVEKVNILERNVADLEKQVVYLQDRLREAQDQMYDCSKKLNSYMLQHKGDE